MNLDVKGMAARGVRQFLLPSRLVLAAKTAVAAAIAWYLAPYVPFAESEYSYYAPLGVLVSMYPTAFDSARSGAQALFGLATGIGLGIGAIALVHLGAPGIIAVAVVVGVGVAIGGLRVFGSGREWVPIAGLFVLLLSGGDASEFTLSYLVTMGFGLLVGVLVQWIAIPPLYVTEAQNHLTELQLALSNCLLKVAEVIEQESNGSRSLQRSVKRLTDTETTVSAEIYEARRSVRVNPRARRRRDQRANMDGHFQSLISATLHVRALADFAEQLSAETAPDIPDALRRLLHEATLQCRARFNNKGESQDPEELAASARATLDPLLATVAREDPAAHSSVTTETAMAACLIRLLDALDE